MKGLPRRFAPRNDVLESKTMLGKYFVPFKVPGLFLVFISLGLFIAALLLRSLALDPISIIFTSLVFIHVLFGIIPWNGANPQYRGLGIEEHYQQALCIHMYLLAAHSILRLLFIPTLVLDVIGIVVGVVFLIAGLMLLSYHLKDKDNTPPAYFAAELYLKDNN